MKLQFAFLADFALAHPDGKIYVLGGGFDTIYASVLPARHPHLSLVMNLQFAATETGRTYPIEIHAQDSTGAPFLQVMTIEANPQRNLQAPTSPVTFQSVLNFQGVQLRTAGEHTFTILVDGQELAAVPLRVTKVAATDASGRRPN
ncbi:MAG TPA: hypothetical protein VJO72_09605 [Candidatus Dormibacteraeota bacterium]|nr:MAG: hypothetical protein E6J01_00575 [Chloroflexota bacterium]HLB77276.1 hypothetical protein [Candidatus Dormibacteraeota bacterium]